MEDLSPEGYGLKADSVPEGFVASGADNDTWISVCDEDGNQQWIRTSDVGATFIHDDGTPTKHESPSSAKKKRKISSKVVEEVVDKVPKKGKKDDSPSKMSKTGSIKSKSGLLWLGDPIDLFIYAQKYSMEHFLKQINKNELAHKKVCTAARGLAWTSVDTVTAKPVYCSEKPGDKQPESICVMLSK
jgi:hypothetical protein